VECGLKIIRKCTLKSRCASYPFAVIVRRSKFAHELGFFQLIDQDSLPNALACLFWNFPTAFRLQGLAKFKKCLRVERGPVKD